jgi:hypothetical protein
VLVTQLLKLIVLNLLKKFLSSSRPENRKTGHPFGFQDKEFFAIFGFVISSPGRIEKKPVIGIF